MEISAARAMSPVNQFAASQAYGGLNANQAAAKADSLQGAPQQDELRKAFDSFVGETFYGQLLNSMQKSVGKAAYFHGGQGEEVFRGQLNQTLATKMTEANGGDFTNSLFELFNLTRG